MGGLIFILWFAAIVIVSAYAAKLFFSGLFGKD